MCGHILDMFASRPEDNISDSCYVTHSLSIDHHCVYCNLSINSPANKPDYNHFMNIQNIDSGAFSCDLCQKVSSKLFFL